MKNAILVGPILGVESDEIYTVCVLTKKTVNQVKVVVGEQEIQGSLILETPTGLFWRVELEIAVESHSKFLTYQVKLNEEFSEDKNKRSNWSFYVPGLEEKPKLAYASCNGFSCESLKEKTSDPYRMWKLMYEGHQQAPFSVLMMGGDQVYADSIWSDVKALSDWSDLPRKEKVKRRASKELKLRIDSFYDKLYKDRWSNPFMSLMMASVPSIMMWDDHDITDGWGSYPTDIQDCDVYKCIFENAKKYFDLYQIRTHKNKTLMGNLREHASLCFVFRETRVIALDNRSKRTQNQIMSSEQWLGFRKALDETKQKNTFILAAVPVVYRDFSFPETVVDFTPWEEELADDIKDHWRAKKHQSERIRLIMNLVQKQRRDGGRIVVLSGDLHIGCLGVIVDTHSPQKINKIHQVVSSAVVHPPPNVIEWCGMMAVTSEKEEIFNEEGTIKSSMLQPQGSRKYIRSRNFAVLQEGVDDKLWVNWVCENEDTPVYPLE